MLPERYQSIGGLGRAIVDEETDINALQGRVNVLAGVLEAGPKLVFRNIVTAANDSLGSARNRKSGIGERDEYSDYSVAFRPRILQERDFVADGV